MDETKQLTKTHELFNIYECCGETIGKKEVRNWWDVILGKITKENMVNKVKLKAWQK